MRIALRLFAITLLSFGINLAAVDDADARRLGGGRSLGKGSGSLFNRSANRPRSPSQQAAFSKNQQARQQMSQRGGLMGLLGGLAIGGLLGALFFGGAFENLSFIDLLVFGGIAYLLFRVFAARRHAAARAGGPVHAAHNLAPEAMARENGSTAEGSQLASRPATPGEARHDTDDGDADFGADDAVLGDRPADFDERAFLDGARRAYELLQQSWNTQDLGEIRGLTTDQMFAELQDQANEPDADAYVEVLKVEAELLNVRQVGSRQQAAVLFDAILREGAEEQPAQVRELWHFTRTAGALAPKWLLEGIEQLEG